MKKSRQTSRPDLFVARWEAESAAVKRLGHDLGLTDDEISTVEDLLTYWDDLDSIFEGLAAREFIELMRRKTAAVCRLITHLEEQRMGEDNITSLLTTPRIRIAPIGSGWELPYDMITCSQYAVLETWNAGAPGWICPGSESERRQAMQRRDLWIRTNRLQPKQLAFMLAGEVSSKNLPDLVRVKRRQLERKFHASPVAAVN